MQQRKRNARTNSNSLSWRFKNKKNAKNIYLEIDKMFIELPDFILLKNDSIQCNGVAEFEHIKTQLHNHSKLSI